LLLKIRGFNSISETSELPDHLGGAPLLGFFGDCRAPFFVTNSIVEELPDEEALPTRNHSDSLFVSEAAAPYDESGMEATSAENVAQTSTGL
jgi:hypothetical protein